MAAREPSRLAPFLQEDAEDLYEHAPCGYLSWLPDGEVVRVNQTFLDWTGHVRGDVVGARRFSDLLTVGGRIYHETHVAPLLRMQDEVREIALELRCADGRRLPVLLNSAVRRDTTGEVVVVRTTVFDATDRHAYERELLLARRRERAARERVERLQRVTARLAVGLEPEAIAGVLCTELGGLEGVAQVQVALVDHGIAGSPAGLALVPGPGMLDPDPELARALATKEPVFSEHDEAGGEARALLPLVADGALRGIVRLCGAATGLLDDDDRALLHACAAQAAQALARARLHAQALVDADRAEVLADVGRALDDTLAPDAQLEQLLHRMVPDVADVAWIVRADGTIQLAPDEPTGPADVTGTGELPELLDADGLRWSCAEALLRSHGLLRVARALPERAFDDDDRDFVEEVGDRAGAALEIARLSARDREVASTLQESLLAGDLPDDARLPLTSAYRPSVEGLQVGGDWFDAFRLGPDAIGLVIGDVVGRGLEAATTMGQLRSAVRALAVSSPGPGTLLEQLDAFAERVQGAEGATLAYAEIDLGTGAMRYACAGHPPPVAAPEDGAAQLLWGGRSAPLGAFFGTGRRAEAEVTLAPGTRVVLYTDGLVERRAVSLDVQLSRLCAEVDARFTVPLQAFGRRLADAMLADAGPADDVCLLAVTFGAGRELSRELRADYAEVTALRSDLHAWATVNGVEGDDAHALVLACSEAATNAIEHGYRDGPGTVRVHVACVGDAVEVEVRDHGRWKPPGPAGDRGRGLLIMERAMESVDLRHDDGGTVVVMRRRRSRRSER